MPRLCFPSTFQRERNIPPTPPTCTVQAGHSNGLLQSPRTRPEIRLTFRRPAWIGQATTCSFYGVLVQTARAARKFAATRCDQFESDLKKNEVKDGTRSSSHESPLLSRRCQRAGRTASAAL